jgi:outer membrane protein assembly factor BamB
MNRSQLYRHLAACIATAGLVVSAMDGALAWQTSHGQPDNSGFADVVTTPATVPLPNAPRLGGVAAGINPVITANGSTVYLSGGRKLMAFFPDGRLWWTRDLPRGQGILSSPAIGSDGAIYVVGAATIRSSDSEVPTHIAELHRFDGNGPLRWSVKVPGGGGNLDTSAAPNILTVAGTDIIMLPTVRKFGGFQTRLTAFAAADGTVLDDKIVTTFTPTTTGGSGGVGEVLCSIVTLGGCDGSITPAGPAPDPVHLLSEKQNIPFPSVAIVTPAGMNVPMILMSDGHRDLVGYSFAGSKFQERFRVHDDKRALLSTPVAWADGHAMVTTKGYQAPPGTLLAGLGFSTITGEAPLSFAAPSALGAGRFVIVDRYGGIMVVRGTARAQTIALPGHSVASASISRNQVYVSTASALYSFDKATMTMTGQFAWKRGGVSQPAISPDGHVYAIADDRLYVFPPPTNTPLTDAGGAGGPAAPLGGGVMQPTVPTQPPVYGFPVVGTYQDANNPATQTPQGAQSQQYKPPVTANNNRLFACEELDGDDCGKGDHRAISLAFCQKQGFSKAADFDVDSRKGTAETLDGRFCSKNKCKVFDEIVCAN